MRFLIFVLILLVLDWYAFQAFRTITQQWSATLRNAVTVVYWAVPVLLLLYILASQTGSTDSWPKSLTTFLRSFLFIAYFSKFLIVIVMLADDIRRASLWVYEKAAGREPFDYSRSRFLSNFGVVLGSIPFLTLSYGILRNPYRYQLFRENVVLDDLPEALNGLRIVHISDIHSGSMLYREPVKASVEMINAQKPDLVFFTGDLVNNVATEMDGFLDIFDKIEAKYGVYSIFGNHDYGDYVSWPSPEAKTANLEQLKAVHKRLGWQLLLDENRILDINGADVAVIGVQNYSTHMRFPKYGNLEKAYEGAGPAVLKLLLSHDPSHWSDQVTSLFKDIAITFSGHTHGMQFGVEIPGWLKWSPVQYVYKEWAGLYSAGKQFLYVNRGLGFLGYPGRVGILPEVTLLELKKSN
jgi:uncharacterized protein